jgi:hypothetical protein
MIIQSIADYRRAIRVGPYAWPGGYPVFFVMSDGESLSFKAAKSERRLILEALADHASGNRHESSGWRPIALEINFEDSRLYCAHSGELIESAYGELEEESENEL